MRKRNFLLAAAAFAAGLGITGFVVAQQPAQPPVGGAYNQPVMPPYGATIPAQPATPPATVRPYNQWTPPGVPPSTGVQSSGGFLPPPAGYTPNNQYAQGLQAQPSGITQAGGFLPPPPNLGVMSSPLSSSSTGAIAPPALPSMTQTTGLRPPPMVTQDPASPAPLSVPTGPSTPVVSLPAAGGVGTPALPPVPDAHAPLLPPGVSSPPSTFPTPPVLPSTPIVPAGPHGDGSASTLPGALPLPSGAMPSGPAAMMPSQPVVLPGRLMHNVVLETVCPESVVFGQEFRYELIVKNTGNVAVSGVKVDDELPTGAKYVGSDPPAELNGDRLTWTVGAIDAGGEKRIAIRVKTEQEGEIHSRATVTFMSAVDARTKVTRPRLNVSINAGDLCRTGEEAEFKIKVSNSGSGPAQRMILTAKLSDGLFHKQGSLIEAELAMLPPNATKEIPLRVNAAKAGLQWCQITVVAEGSPDATAKASVNVVEPMLQVSQTGPVKCHVRAEPSYDITLGNPGTAATDPITLYSVLPDGFEFIQANENGNFDASRRMVIWKLTGLPPGGTKVVNLKLRAAAAGDVMLKTIAQSIPETSAINVAGVNAADRPTGRVLEQKAETAIRAEGVAAIKFEVTDIEDPVEVGKEAVYEIRVTNQGTGACTNVQLVAAMAEGTTYTGSSGPTQIKVQGQGLVFDPIQQLPVKGEAVYRVKVKSTVAGDLRFAVKLTCDQVKTPVVKEESTNFYKE